MPGTVAQFTPRRDDAFHETILTHFGFVTVLDDHRERVLPHGLVLSTNSAGRNPSGSLNQGRSDHASAFVFAISRSCCSRLPITTPHEFGMALFTAAAATSVPGGLFVVTFRDYVSSPLKDDGRFILVRSDEIRILTCFLEYGEATVQVHDVLHERDGGSWRLRLSSCPKLGAICYDSRVHPRSWTASSRVTISAA